METYQVIVGDVGGTNSRLQLVLFDHLNLISRGVLPGQVLFEKTYRNENFDDFESIMRLFLDDAKRVLTKSISFACIGVAAPITVNTAVLTNRAVWKTVNGDNIAREFMIDEVLIINDFVALGYGLLTLDEEKECCTLESGRRELGAPIACVGAGTGLGECFLTIGTCGGYVVYPTEGGHAEFSPRTDIEIELLLFLKEKFKAKHRISVERVISGPGLMNIYEFLCHKYPERVDLQLDQEIKNAGELHGKVISQNSLVKGSLCELVMQIFTSAYGAEAGVAGLKWIPRGGLYIAGGLTPKNIHWIQGESPEKSLFLQAFHDKGRVSPILKHIPLYAVMVEDCGVRGARLVAFQKLQEKRMVTSNITIQKNDKPDHIPIIVVSTLIGILIGCILSSKQTCNQRFTR